MPKAAWQGVSRLMGALGLGLPLSPLAAKDIVVTQPTHPAVWGSCLSGDTSEDPGFAPPPSKPFYPSSSRSLGLRFRQGPPGEKAVEKPGEVQGEGHACPQGLHLREGAALSKPCLGFIFGRGSCVAGRNVNNAVCPVSYSTSHALAHLILTITL